ncbi:MAG TPA: hypothetical protein VF121_15135 [Thermoanaerobaculia bacterium]|nr:hypothetical protein [Thermoanaerobaculia bacterium]
MRKTSIVVCLFALAAALALPLAVQADHHAASWTGWITDDSCGAKGANADHKACAEKCLGNGGKLVFYNPADEKLYALDNQELAAAHLGHEVKVKGELEGDAIKVASIEKLETKAE